MEPEARQHMMSYGLGAVVATGEMAAAAALFLAWNTCSGLKPAETRNAKYAENPLYREIKLLRQSETATDLDRLGLKSKQPDRMQQEEIITELLCSCYAQKLGRAEPLSGKEGVNQILKEADIAKPEDVVEAGRQVKETLRFMAKWLGNTVADSRFKYRAAFHTLFIWINSALQANQGPRLAQDNADVLLSAISRVSTDLVNAGIKDGDGPSLLSSREAKEFLKTLSYASDSKKAREDRMKVLSAAFSRVLANQQAVAA